MSQVQPPHPLIALWPGAEIVFDRAWLSLPDGRADELSRLSLDPAALAELPLVIFQTGSADRGQDKALARWFNGLGLAFLAPRSHLVPNRLTYQSPAPMEIYQRIHDLRRREIDYCLQRLEAAGLFDLNRIALIGLSEGAVAAATWNPARKCPRVILAWSMEDSYFGRELTFPRDPNCPILNVIGGKDPFFGAQGSLASIEQVIGHGAEVLGDYPNAKVVIYPQCGHRVADDPQCEADVVNFVVQHLAPAQLSGPQDPQQRTA